MSEQQLAQWLWWLSRITLGDLVVAMQEEDDGEYISSVSGVYATEGSARSAARRLNEMRRSNEPQVRGTSYVLAEEVRP